MARSSGKDAPAPCVVWFRQDLRLADNPALASAVASGRPIIPLYILDDTDGPWAMGAASRWWLHGSLAALAKDIDKRGGALVLRRGDPAVVLRAFAADTGAAQVVWNRCYEPAAIARDKQLKSDLAAAGLLVESFNAGLLFEPWEVRTKEGGPFKVYSPFWRACLAKGLEVEPAPAPKHVPGPVEPVASLSLHTLALEPRTPDWAGGLRAEWTPGEVGAAARLTGFLDGPLDGYGDLRNRPDIEATSRLSPHLHFGEISPRQVWRAVETFLEAHPGHRGDGAKFLSEIGWREFATHLLFHWPDLPEKNWKPDFDAFPWQANPDGLKAWRRGRTGYPIVDAGMRELWATGYMHNRVRMIVASFLIKDLMVDWRVGETWFWDTLVDADLANNAASWQWVAGSGADAAPYFRVFNPVTQGETYDPQGAYVRRWVPEIAALPDAVIHKPWTAAPEVLSQAGIHLGRDYPRPIVDHGAARIAALAAYKAVSGKDAAGEKA